MMKVLFIGQLTDNSGYGNAARSYVSTLSKLHESGDIELSLLNHSFESASSLKEEEKRLIQKYSLIDHGDFTPYEKLLFYTEKNITKIQKYLDDNKDNFYVMSLIVPDLYKQGRKSNNLAYKWSSDRKSLNRQSICIPYVMKYAAGLYPCFVWEFDSLPKEWIKGIHLFKDKIVKFVSACSWNKEVIERCTNKSL